MTNSRIGNVNSSSAHKPVTTAGRRQIVRVGAIALAHALAVLWQSGASAEAPFPPALYSERSQFILIEPQKEAPLIKLAQPSGQIVDIAKFRGKVILLNFWASWCAPCAEEMPSLDALAKAIPSSRLTVVAVALDSGDGRSVRAFLKRHPLQNVTVLLDPDHRFGSFADEARSPRTIPVYGLPTSYILDMHGRLVGYLTGAVDWNSEPAKTFIGYFAGLQ